MIRMAGSLLSTVRLRPLFYDLPFHSDARGARTKVDWNHTDLNLNSQYQRTIDQKDRVQALIKHPP